MNETSIQNLKREVMLLSTFENPSILKFLEVYEKKAKKVYIVTEHIIG